MSSKSWLAALALSILLNYFNEVMLKRFCYACQSDPEKKEWYYSIFTKMDQKLMKLDGLDILSNS